MDSDDLEPRKPIEKPKDLDLMGIDELEEYLQALQSEVAEVKRKIEAKRAYLSGAAGLFKG